MISMDRQAKAKSVHIFVWPFKIKETVPGKGDSKIRGFVNECVKGQKWKKKNLSISHKKPEDEDYRECFMLNQYLTIPARQIFMPDNEGDSFWRKEDICSIYEYQMEEDEKYEYLIAVGEKEYRLPVASIELHLYHHGVGMLFIRVINENYSTIKDIKLINDYGRRISLPFIPEEEEGYILCADMLGIVKRIQGKEEKHCTCFRQMIRDFCEGKYEKAGNLNRTAEFLFELLNYKQPGENFLIEPIADDRMFLFALIRDNELSEKIEKKQWKTDETFGQMLYSVLYADAEDATCQDVDMRKELLQNAVYPRWIDYGTMYGVTGYSIICLTSESEAVKHSVVRPFLVEYIYLLSLTLTQKIGIELFSEAAGEIVEGFDKEGVISRKKTKRLINLQEQYITFKNQVLILEVSSQEQGIEIYRLLQKQFLIEQEQGLLNEQLESLYEATNVSFGNWIGKWGVWLAVMAIVIDVVMNVVIFLLEHF